MSSLILAILLLTFVATNSQICYKTTSSNRQYSVYRMIYRIESYDCGNKIQRTCTRRVSGAASMPVYRTVYETVAECCPGYYTVDSACRPLCRASCSNGTVCVAPDVCACPPGWTGNNCETDINECDTPGTCDHHCTNTNGSFVCSCQNGYLLNADGTSCNDINECELTNNCNQNCHNTEGSYNCSCNPGTTLNTDGYQCDDIDECGMSNGHNCSVGCQNTYGSFNCTCNSGFELDSDGRTCNDIDECARGSHHCEQLCINNEGSYECACFNHHTLLSNLKNCLGPPQNVSLVAMDSTSLELSWDPPVPDAEDGAIITYHVRCTSQQDTGFLYTDTQPPTANRRLNIGNLRPFTDYACCVSVQTSRGTSPMVCLHQITMEATPNDPPVISFISSSSPSTLSVFALPPQAPNGLITSYSFYVTFENGTSRALSGETGLLQLHGLLPYELVAIQVSANTSAGESPRSAINFTRTEEDVPTMVTNPIVEVMSNRSISVSWSPPVRANGIITNYTIRVYTNTSIDNNTVVYTLPNHPLSVNVSYLVPYIPYEVEITASTVIGKGSSWEQIIYTQYGAPTVSILVLRTANNSAVLQLKLDLSPELSGLILASLTVSHTPASGQSCPSEISSSHSASIQPQLRNVFISGLKASQEYCVSVALVTITGETAQSPVQKLALPSNVYIQMGLSLTGQTCLALTEDSPTTTLASVSSALLQATLATCNCSYSIQYIDRAQILCSESRQDLAIYQAHLLNTDTTLAEDLVPHIQKWLLNSPDVNVGGGALLASQYCRVDVDELGRVEECFSVNPTGGVRERGTSVHITIGSVLGAVVGVTFLLLLVAAAARLTRQFYLSKEKRILNERNLNIACGDNCFSNPGFHRDEIKPYKMYR